MTPMHLQKAWRVDPVSPLADSSPQVTPVGNPVSGRPKNGFFSGFLAFFEQKVDFFNNFGKFPTQRVLNFKNTLQCPQNSVFMVRNPFPTSNEHMKSKSQNRENPFFCPFFGCILPSKIRRNLSNLSPKMKIRGQK